MPLKLLIALATSFGRDMQQMHGQWNYASKLWKAVMNGSLVRYSSALLSGLKLWALCVMRAMHASKRENAAAQNDARKRQREREREREREKERERAQDAVTMNCKL